MYTTVNKGYVHDSFCRTQLFFPLSSPQFSPVQSLSHVRLFVTPWITARQAPCTSPTPGVHSLNLKLHPLGKKYQCYAYTNYTHTHTHKVMFCFFYIYKKITCYPFVWNLSEYIFHVWIKRRKVVSHFFFYIAISLNNKNETHFSALNNFIKHNLTCWPPGQHILIEPTVSMTV